MRKCRVLVVEDDDMQRELYTVLLEMNGFEVRSVASGNLAFEELHRVSPDVILTDIAMPDMGGLELVSKVKDESEFADVPIVVMTAYDSHYLQWAQCLGAAQTLSKPFEPEDLYNTILHVLPQA